MNLASPAARKEIAGAIHALVNLTVTAGQVDAVEAEFDGIITALEMQNCLDGGASRSLGIAFHTLEAQLADELAREYKAIADDLGQLYSVDDFVRHNRWLDFRRIAVELDALMSRTP